MPYGDSFLLVGGYGDDGYGGGGSGGYDYMIGGGGGNNDFGDPNDVRFDDMTFGDHIWNFFKQKSIKATVTLHPEISDTDNFDIDILSKFC